MDDYIPKECWDEAKCFFAEITDEIEIYKKIRKLGSVKQNDEADKFVAWWELGRYCDYNHSLFLIYENIGTINSSVGEYDLQDAFMQQQMKMVLLYRLLKENGMINE